MTTTRSEPTLTIFLTMILTTSLGLTPGLNAVAQPTPESEKICLTEEAWNDRVDREVAFECDVAKAKASQRDEAVAGEREAEKSLAEANGRIQAMASEIARATTRAQESAERAAVAEERTSKKWSTFVVVLVALGSAVLAGGAGFVAGAAR